MSGTEIFKPRQLSLMEAIERVEKICDVQERVDTRRGGLTANEDGLLVKLLDGIFSQIPGGKDAVMRARYEKKRIERRLTALGVF